MKIVGAHGTSPMLGNSLSMDAPVSVQSESASANSGLESPTNVVGYSSGIGTLGIGASLSTSGEIPVNATPSSSRDAFRAADKLNHMLAASSLKVEVAQNKPAGQVWLNVIDQSTGHVVQEIPPEGIRKLLEGQTSIGLNLDMIR